MTRVLLLIVFKSRGLFPRSFFMPEHVSFLFMFVCFYRVFLSCFLSCFFMVFSAFFVVFFRRFLFYFF